MQKQQNICRNGPQCYFKRVGKCRFNHPQLPNQIQNNGLYKCPKQHQNPKLQYTGRKCDKCAKLRDTVYGIQCKTCNYYICCQCLPIRHGLVCGYFQLSLHKEGNLKHCRRCSALVHPPYFTCKSKCNYSICLECAKEEQVISSQVYKVHKDQQTLQIAQIDKQAEQFMKQQPIKTKKKYVEKKY